MFWAVSASALTALVAGLGLLGFLIAESVPVFQRQGLSFLTGAEWFGPDEFGAWPMIYGSLATAFVASLFALPVALGSAVYTAEFLSPKPRLAVKAVMEYLAGVPGIVYGLLGMTLLAQWVRNVFDLIDGNSIFTAGLLLAIMILPTVTTLSEDALRAVPRRYRETAWSLGMNRVATAFCVSLPMALPGICGAVFLGVGRALGETVAVMLVIGGLDRVPVPWFNLFAPGQSIPSKLGREAAEALGGGYHWHALMTLGLVLFVLALCLSLAGRWFLTRQRSA